MSTGYRIEVRYAPKAWGPFATGFRMTRQGAEEFARRWILEANQCGYEAEAKLIPVPEAVAAAELGLPCQGIEQPKGRRRSEVVAERRQKLLDELTRRRLPLSGLKLPITEIAVSLDVPLCLVEDDLTHLRRKEREEYRRAQAGPRLVGSVG